MDSFEEHFIQTFDTETLKGEVATLEGLRPVDVGPSSANSIFERIQKSKNFLAVHLPWVSDTDVYDIQKRIRSWVLNKQFNQGGCWQIFRSPVAIGGLPQYPAGFIMMEVNLRNRSATFSYWLFEEFTGKGLMTDAVNLLANYCLNSLRLNRIELMIAIDNHKSAAVAKRCGFSEEGICRDYELIHGKFVDHRRYSLLAKDIL